MAAPQTERLRGIKTLPQLLAYLRDELDWPIESNDTENVTFDYEASELGLDEKSAVRIKEIKQLRPLSGNQPWGIFFVNFEKKALPVMVMRRILRSLVFKKRTTAGKSERQAWNASDLLFVSSYGEEDERAITFAHFVEDEDLGGLAELRVLGWDDDDTPLKYDYVAHTLHEKLRWRDEYERKPDEWRNHWRSAFELRHREVITTSKQLASQLADLAKKIRARVRSVLRYEDGFGQIRKLHNAFKKALIHDLSDDDFADMYAQTITYGLFSAAVSRPAGIHGQNIVDMVPVTNPFLRDMLQTFLNLSGRKGRIDFDELGIQEVVALLNSAGTHLDAVLRDFGNRTQREDPVIHFYEDFLREYDARKKIQRGVFYTPQPVVSYIVRSVHELLQTEFGLQDGLADTTTWGEMAGKHADLKLPEGVKPQQAFVQILDPATGTATFLVEVIDVIHRHLKAKWDKGGLKQMPTLPATSFPRLASVFAEYWNQYVALALLPRLHGYELMMAPYAIAHMKIGLKLFETGYRFGSDERARIYLTNALEPPSDLADQPEFEAWAPALAHEAKAVNAVKRHQRFTVVIGNPPYSIRSGNLTDEARQLIQPFKFVAGQRIVEKGALQLEKNLNDDYVKFFGLIQKLLATQSVGVVGLITNHAFLDNPTFRGFRWNLLSQFSRIQLLDLHGNSKKKEQVPQGTANENVFDIQQGVGISVLLRRPSEGLLAAVTLADQWGTRDEKYHALNTGRFDYRSIECPPPWFKMSFQDAGIGAEFNSFVSLADAMPANSTGIKTHP